MSIRNTREAREQEVLRAVKSLQNTGLSPTTGEVFNIVGYSPDRHLISLQEAGYIEKEGSRWKTNGRY